MLGVYRNEYLTVHGVDALATQRAHASNVHDPLLHTACMKHVMAWECFHGIALLEALQTDGALFTLASTPQGEHTCVLLMIGGGFDAPHRHSPLTAVPEGDDMRASVQHQQRHPYDNGQLEEGDAHVPEGGSE